MKREKIIPFSFDENFFSRGASSTATSLKDLRRCAYTWRHVLLYPRTSSYSECCIGRYPDAHHIEMQGKRFMKHMLCNQISSNTVESAYTMMSCHPNVRQPHLEQGSAIELPPVKSL